MKKIVVCSLLIFILVLQNGSIVSASEKSAQPNELFDITQYHGKVVYLDFWASWCVPCRKSFPWMNQLRQTYTTEQLIVIAVNLDKKRALAEKFLKENPANFEIIYDPKGQLAKHYAIKGMPSSVIFDKTGKPVIAHTGFFTKKINQYEQEIRNIVIK